MVYFQQNIAPMHSKELTKLMRHQVGSYPCIIVCCSLLVLISGYRKQPSLLCGCLCARAENPCSQIVYISKDFSFPFVLGFCLGKVNLTCWISVRHVWPPFIGCSRCCLQSFLYNLIFAIVSFPACFPLGLAFDLAGELGGRLYLENICAGALSPTEALGGMYMSLPVLFMESFDTNCSSSLASLAALLPAAAF